MATHPGFEPGTSSLTVKRSAAELMRIIFLEDAKRLELLSVLPRQFSKLLPYQLGYASILYMEESIVIETNRINYNLLSKQLHKPL